ncbi:transposase [Desulfurobacterium indicum]|uniref:Transposase n=1 Tax=Desulfurobacterium indicum TaxID=1914305 RepID=A0A1R1MJH8_9BACT|nr:transposase [Desulfurobacterium indicum]
MSRRNFDPDTKVAIVLEGLKGNTTIAEVCRKYQISETLYYKWRDKFLEGGRRAFISPENDRIKELEKKIEELEKIIGRQTVQIEILKKTF